MSTWSGDESYAKRRRREGTESAILNDLALSGGKRSLLLWCRGSWKRL